MDLVLFTQYQYKLDSSTDSERNPFLAFTRPGYERGEPFQPIFGRHEEMSLVNWGIF